MENESDLPELLDAPVPAPCRRDGWTPFYRRLFLEVLAETGRVTTACEYAQLSKQSAYALRARDPMFAAGWDAACELSRAPLADALYEKAVDGITDTITKDGEVVAERHRFDSRLSIAVLHRLDKRCDRAAEAGSRHLGAVRNWDQWIGHVGRGEDEAAAALLQTADPQIAPHGQFGQLALGGNPTAGPESHTGDGEGIDFSDRCWKDEDEVWMTNFPPPRGFAGYQNRPFGDHPDIRYRRACTAEEAATLEADEARAVAARLTEEERDRDDWFALLRQDIAEAQERAAFAGAQDAEYCSGESETAD